MLAQKSCAIFFAYSRLTGLNTEDASQRGLSASNKRNMFNRTVRKRARQFGRLVRSSALTPRTGMSYKPVLTGRDQLGVTFIGHSSFLLQLEGRKVVVDPNFARWLVVLKRLRRPGIRPQDLPPIDFVLVTHAHMDHLHRPSLRQIA